MALQVDKDCPKDDPSPSPQAALSSLKETCSSIIDAFSDTEKDILTHYADHTVYDAATRSYIRNHFLAPSVSHLVDMVFFSSSVVS